MLSGKAFIGGQGYASNHLNANDYYEKGKTVEGIWTGKACREFGVTQGALVLPEEFEAIRQNLHALTGEQLTKRNNTTRTIQILNEKTGMLEEKEVSNRRNFYDFTISAPKSFSVMAVTMEDERIREWHKNAVTRMLEEMEKAT